jgi:hypothetical protein
MANTTSRMVQFMKDNLIRLAIFMAMVSFIIPMAKYVTQGVGTKIHFMGLEF